MKIFTKRLRNKKGFTLVELIVVLGILAILAGLAAPKFMGVQENARKSADITNAATIANAVNIQMVAEKFTVPTEGLNFEVVSLPTLPATPTAEQKAQKALTDYMQTIPTIKSSANAGSGSTFYIMIDANQQIKVYDTKADTKVELYPTPSPKYK